MKILAAYEGDFDNIGRKTELALLVAARKKDGASYFFSARQNRIFLKQFFRLPYYTTAATVTRIFMQTQRALSTA